MDIPKILIAAFSATNIMTTFSYLISKTYDKLFLEPVLLNYILKSVNVCLKGRWAKFSGWLAHYIIGVFFVVIYYLVWRYTSLKFGWISAIVLGVASGIVGILGWRLIYKLPDKKPAAPLAEYYVQLFFAHVVFACAVVLAFKIIDYDPVAHLDL
jgi:hypothetical protein